MRVSNKIGIVHGLQARSVLYMGFSVREKGREKKRKRQSDVSV